MAAFSIDRLDVSDARRKEAMRLILSQVGESVRDADRRIQRLTEYLEHQPVRMGEVLGAFVSDRLIGAVLLIESPGSLGAVFVPPHEPRGLRRQATVALLHELQERAWRRSLAALQALLAKEDAELARLYADAGFDFLAELAYLERPCQPARPDFETPDGLNLVPFSTENEELFVQVLAATYSASLDCPRLAGTRRPEDVLATHRATGIHDPNHWWVAKLHDRPAGILLLAATAGRRAFEVVYIGVTPEARGRGLGDALLSVALDVCDRDGQADLTLAVDSDNTPANRLYERWGFREVSRRQAWFCTPAMRPVANC